LDENWKRSSTTSTTKRRHCGTKDIVNLFLFSPISISTVSADKARARPTEPTRKGEASTRMNLPEASRTVANVGDRNLKIDVTEEVRSSAHTRSGRSRPTFLRSSVQLTADSLSVPAIGWYQHQPRYSRPDRGAAMRRRPSIAANTASSLIGIPPGRQSCRPYVRDAIRKAGGE
jgi:hypothetical protein